METKTGLTVTEFLGVVIASTLGAGFTLGSYGSRDLNRKLGLDPGGRLEQKIEKVTAQVREMGAALTKKIEESGKYTAQGTVYTIKGEQYYCVPAQKK